MDPCRERSRPRRGLRSPHRSGEILSRRDETPAKQEFLMERTTGFEPTSPWQGVAPAS
jgi:hypothetical protein